MNYTEVFRKRIGCNNSQEVFNYLLSSLKDTITSWDFFVNWAKVFKGIKNIEVDLNIINYLIGKDNIEQEFKALIDTHPSIIRVIPILIACRETKFKILTDFSDSRNFQYENYNFSEDSDISKDKVVEFARKTGFLNLLKDKKLKNVVDYVIGVEVGLDSNGRKNRGGSAMEKMVEFYIKNICEKNKLDYLREATSKDIKDTWGMNLKVDKSSRRLDFVVKKGDLLILVETNFYSGGGSKLKSTAGEYKSMYDFWKKDRRQFIWITDGAGWKTTKLPLQETFEYTDYIFNLDMISKGLLEDIILNY